MNAKTWNQVTGVILILLAVLGLLGIGLPGLLSVNEPGELALHVVTGAIALYAGFSSGGYGALAVPYAKYGGLVYLLLGIVGFVSPDIAMSAGGIHLDLLCNVAHVVLGAWGAYVGFMAPAPSKAKA